MTDTPSVMTAFRTKPFILFLSLAVLALTTFSGRADAMFVRSSPGPDPATGAAASAQRAADIARVQKALESRIIRQKLMDLGLTREEALVRLDGLSSEQVHELAAHTDALQAGGNPTLLALYIFAALIAIYIVGTVAAGIVGCLMIRKDGKPTDAGENRNEGEPAQSPEPAR